MATTARCATDNQIVTDHCKSPTCPWVKCPTCDLVKLDAATYFLLRGRKA